MKTYNVCGAFPPRIHQSLSKAQDEIIQAVDPEWIGTTPGPKHRAEAMLALIMKREVVGRSEGAGIGIKAGAFRSVWKKSRSLRKPLRKS
jgi:hypothetical protein